ncbi:hypothetical protein OHA21_38005 [Actinoplanes sp. NBC_00393]|uniref:hypothetical protein n=1 Tax=Actinoplanes sp. NBC_00393 TaxID=2975953 RepID=UPI002E1DE22B
MAMTRQGPASEEGMPRWVKSFLITGVVLLVVVLVAVLSGHGPGRHMGQGSLPAASGDGHR